MLPGSTIIHVKTNKRNHRSTTTETGKHISTMSERVRIKLEGLSDFHFKIVVISRICVYIIRYSRDIMIDCRVFVNFNVSSFYKSTITGDGPYGLLYI